MEKVLEKKWVILGVLCAIVVALFCAKLYLNSNKKEVVPSEDEIKFKEEYEQYNGKVNEGNGKNYPVVEIDEFNKVVYKTPEEILDVMKNEDALIYFGWSTCPWCRNTVGPLLKAAKEAGVEKVYYVDILKIRDSYKYENKKVVQTQKGTDAYYKLLEVFGDKLTKFYVTDEKGKKHDTGVTRMYAPTVAVVKHGTVKDVHIGTIESQTDPYVVLDEKGKEELKKIFIDLIKKLNEPEVCSSDTAC